MTSMRSFPARGLAVWLLVLSLPRSAWAAPQKTTPEEFDRVLATTKFSELSSADLSDEASIGRKVLYRRTINHKTSDTIREFWKLGDRFLVDCNLDTKARFDYPHLLFVLPQGREIDDYPELQFKNQIYAICVLKPMAIDRSGFPSWRPGPEIKVMPELVAIVDKDDYDEYHRQRGQREEEERRKRFADYAIQQREERLAKERAEKERQLEARRQREQAKASFDRDWAKKKWTTPSRRLQGSWQGTFGGYVLVINASGRGVYGSFGGDPGRWRQAGKYLDWQSNSGSNIRFSLELSDDGKSLSLYSYIDGGTLTFFKR